MSLRYARTIGLLLVLVAAAPAAQEETQTLVEQLQALADRRAAAVVAGDKDAFMATVDPEAPPDFKASQAVHFDGLRAMPLEGYRLTVDDADTGDLSPPGLADRRYGGARVHLPETTATYRIRGYDDRDAVDALWITYVERGEGDERGDDDDGEWYVGGDTDLDAVGLETTRNLWDLGPVRLLPTDHFLVVSHPDTARRADDLARLAEEAAARLADVWDRPWSGRIPIVLPSSVDELEVLLQSTFDLDNFVAFVAYGIDRDAPSGFETTAARMFIQDRNLSTYDEDFQIETLVHELVHAATAPHTGPFVDDWVHEGVADWVSTGRRTDEKAPDRSDGRIPDPHEFRAGGRDSIITAYAESRSAVSFLAATDGPSGPADFFFELGETRKAPGSVDHHVGRALEATATRDFEDFQKAWAGW